MWIFWIALGALLCWPLIRVCEHLATPWAHKLLALSLIVAALIYVGFGLYSGDRAWVLIEGLGVLAYAATLMLPPRTSLLWVGIGWWLHPFWDVGLHLLGPGGHIVPTWYAIVCLSFDLVLGSYIVHRHFRESAEIATTPA